MKKFIAGSVIAAVIGALTAIGFLIAIGVDYRLREDRGVEPGYTPDAIFGGFQAGLWLLGVGLVALIITTSIVAITQHRGDTTASSAASH